MPDSLQIPVSVEVSGSDVLDGIAEINGTLRYADRALTFTYRTTSLTQKVSVEHTVPIPLASVQDAAYRSNVLSTKITVYPKRLAIMETIPGEHGDGLVFKVSRKDRDEAEAFVTRIKDALFASGDPGTESIPFRLADTNLGLTEHSGLLYLEDDLLVFDLQSGISGLTKSEHQLIKIEVRALRGGRLEHGVLNDALYITPKKDALLAALPGTHTAEVRLTVAKRHRRAVERLLRRIRSTLPA